MQKESGNKYKTRKIQLLLRVMGFRLCIRSIAPFAEGRYAIRLCLGIAAAGFTFGECG